MSNSFDYFNEIYCINLDHRTDRWDNVQKEFEKVGILNRVKRFSAIKTQDGRIGLIKSDLELIKYAKKNNLENILILEDDVKFLRDDTNDILNLAIDQINRLKINWQLFYLGANTHTKLVKISPNLVYLTNGYATHSLAFHKSIYDKFINYAENMNRIKKLSDVLDVWISEEIQSKYITLMVNPLLTSQISSFSDIEGKFVNYDFIEERFKNNIS